MIEVPVHDRQGNVVEKIQFDESCLGKFVNWDLLHKAIVMFEANQRLGTHCVKNRRRVVCTTRKPFKQKGTGRARQGFRRRVGSRGGAVAHGPVPHDYTIDMPKKQRRQAIKSALLGKFRDGEVLVVNELAQSAPKTSEIAKTLKSLKVDRGCLVVTKAQDENVWKSIRNIPDADLSPLAEINAYNILKRKHLILTKEVLEAIPSDVK
ncbi:MAG: 50S ribosomal protein L4 [Planctomycetes bacterium]|nr:50S ribosomal protein L4 [Planctomycetota bacterium]